MIRQDCPCTKANCERHGYCDECRQYHGVKGKLPYCERPKRPLMGILKKLIGME